MGPGAASRAAVVRSARLATKKVHPLEHDPDALEAHLDQLARKFDRLRSLYENFFLGIEKQPPLVARREMNRLILETQQLNIGKAAQRFKFQTLNQRWVTYIAYWNRTMREIENGTYRRDVARAQRLIEREGGELSLEQAIAMGVPPGRAQSFVDRQNRLMQERRRREGGTTNAAVPAAPQAGARAAQVPGVSEGELREFYRAYQQARQTTGDQRPLKSLEELAARLRPQIEQILRESRATRAALEVAVEDGKVRVRARPIIP